MDDKPDLKNGYLRLAHELVSALACAGFTKWEWVVLREVFDQIYGLHKSPTARLSPSEVAGKVGTFKETIYRAIRGLVDSGVLIRRDNGRLKFVTTYWTWKDGDQPRLTASEIAYCKSAIHVIASRPSVSAGAHGEGNPSNSMVNNGAHESERQRSRRGAPALTKVSASAHADDVPPTPPIEERARFEKEKLEKENNKGVIHAASQKSAAVPPAEAPERVTPPQNAVTPPREVTPHGVSRQDAERAYNAAYIARRTSDPDPKPEPPPKPIDASAKQVFAKLQKLGAKLPPDVAQ